MNAAVYYSCFAVVAIAAGGVAMRTRVAFVLGRLTGLTERHHHIAATDLGFSCDESNVDFASL